MKPTRTEKEFPIRGCNNNEAAADRLRGLLVKNFTWVSLSSTAERIESIKFSPSSGKEVSSESVNHLFFILSRVKSSRLDD